MSQKPIVNVGIIGYGMMGKAHSYGYRVAPMLFELPVDINVVAIAGRNAQGVEKAANNYQIPRWTTRWQDLIEDPNIDLIDICTPPLTHAEIAIAAAEAGKAIICEKPLAITYTEALAAANAVKIANVPNAIGFNYRRLPAVSLMKKISGVAPGLQMNSPTQRLHLIGALTERLEVQRLPILDAT